MSLNKRLAEWTLGPKKDRPGYLLAHTSAHLVVSLKTRCSDASIGDLQELIRCLTALAEVEELVSVIWSNMWCSLIDDLVRNRFFRDSDNAQLFETFLTSLVPHNCWVPVVRAIVTFGADRGKLVGALAVLVQYHPARDPETVTSHLSTLCGVLLEATRKLVNRGVDTEELLAQSMMEIARTCLVRLREHAPPPATVFQQESSQFHEHALPDLEHSLASSPQANHYAKALLTACYSCRGLLNEVLSLPYSDYRVSMLQLVQSVWSSCMQIVQMSLSAEELSIEAAELASPLTSTVLAAINNTDDLREVVMCVETMFASYRSPLGCENALVSKLWPFLDPANIFLHSAVTESLWKLIRSDKTGSISAITRTVLGSASPQEISRFSVFWEHSGRRDNKDVSHFCFSKVLFFLLDILDDSDLNLQLAARNFLSSDPTQLWRVLDPVLLVLLCPATQTSEIPQVTYALQCLENVLRCRGSNVYTRICGCKTTQVLLDSLPASLQEDSRQVFCSGYAGAVLVAVVAWLDGGVVLSSKHRWSQQDAEKTRLAAARCLQLLVRESYLVDQRVDMEEGHRDFIQRHALSVLSACLKTDDAAIHPMLFDILRSLVENGRNVDNHLRPGALALFDISSDQNRISSSGSSSDAPVPPSLASIIQVVLSDAAPSIMVENWLRFSTSLVPLLLGRSPGLIFPLLRAVAERARTLAELLQIQCMEVGACYRSRISVDLKPQAVFGSRVSRAYIDGILTIMKTLVMFGLPAELAAESEVNLKRRGTSLGVPAIVDYAGRLFVDEGLTSSESVTQQFTTADLAGIFEAPYQLWRTGKDCIAKLMDASVLPGLLDSQVSALQSIMRDSVAVLSALFHRRPYSALGTVALIWEEKSGRGEDVSLLIKSVEDYDPVQVFKKCLDMLRSGTAGNRTGIYVPPDPRLVLEFIDFLVSKETLAGEVLIGLRRLFVAYMRDFLQTYTTFRTLIPGVLRMLLRLSPGRYLSESSLPSDRKEYGYWSQRVLESVAQFAGKIGTKCSWVASPAVYVPSEEMTEPEVLYELVHELCISIGPNVETILNERDKVVSFVATFTSTVVFPFLRLALFKSPLYSIILEALRNLTVLDYTARSWKREAWEIFNDLAYFNQPAKNFPQWMVIARNVIQAEPERLGEILAKVSALQGGLFSSRNQEILNRCGSLRRLSSILLGTKETRNVRQTPSTLARLVESINEASLFETCEILLCVRIMIFVSPPESYGHLLPVIANELLRLTLSLAEMVSENSDLPQQELDKLLQVAKLVDFLVGLKNEDFKSVAWVFSHPRSSSHPLAGGILQWIANRLMRTRGPEQPDLDLNTSLSFEGPNVKPEGPYLLSLPQQGLGGQDLALILLSLGTLERRYTEDPNFPCRLYIERQLLKEVQQPFYYISQNEIQTQGANLGSTEGARRGDSTATIHLGLGDGRTISTSLGMLTLEEPGGKPTLPGD